MYMPCPAASAASTAPLPLFLNCPVAQVVPLFISAKADETRYQEIAKIDRKRAGFCFPMIYGLLTLPALLRGYPDFTFCKGRGYSLTACYRRRRKLHWRCIVYIDSSHGIRWLRWWKLSQDNLPSRAWCGYKPCEMRAESNVAHRDAHLSNFGTVLSMRRKALGTMKMLPWTSMYEFATRW